MTYIVGWVANNAAHLVADTVLTGRKGRRARTSFGQATDNRRGEQLEECALKLSLLGPTTVAAYSGPERLGDACIAFLREHRAQLPLGDLLDSASVSLNHHGDSVDVVLAHHDAQHGGTITLWNSATGVVAPSSPVVQVGSATDFHRCSTDHFVRQLTKDCTDNPILLQSVVAHLQAYGVHDLLTESNIGGVMVGASVGRSGVRFQDDVTYLLCTPDATMGAVLVKVRDGAVVVYSSLSEDGIILANASNTPDLSAWWRKWAPHYRRMGSHPEAPFIALVASPMRNLVLVHHTPTADPRELDFVSDGLQTHVKIRGELAQALFLERRSPPNAQTFTFGYWPQPPLPLGSR